MKKYIYLLLLGATFTLNAQEIVLNIPVATQELSTWCAAAVSQSVLRYLPPNHFIKQCEIMEWVRQEMGDNNCCDVPVNCNDGFVLSGSGSRSVQNVLSYFGGINSNPYSSNYPPLAEIYTYLSDNRPLILHVLNYNYDGHAVVVRGIYLYPGLDVIYYMNPSGDPTYGGNQEVFYLNLISGFNSPYTWVETLIPCSSSRDDPCDDGGGTTDHCKNHRRDPDLGETGIDCGGPDCPECTLCNNCILDEGEDAMDCGGTCCPLCKYIGGITDEVTITNTAQLSREVKAFNKITAGGATTVASGKEVYFITEPTGSIVLLPGFKAESGSKFKTQRKDLNKRFCGAICYDYTLPDHLTKPPEELYIYNLRYAVEFRYDIYEDKERIYSNYFYISRDEDFKLWDCLADIYDASNVPRGRHYYKMKYTIYYCNGAAHLYSKEHDFYVDYDYETLSKDFEDSEDIDTHQSSSSDHLKIQDKKNAPSLSIIPNPNPGTFQIETNFPLSAIGNLKITNLMGATVYETQNVVSNMVQLQNVVSGQFFVVMILKDGAVLTRKMVIQK